MIKVRSTFSCQVLYSFTRLDACSDIFILGLSMYHPSKKNYKHTSPCGDYPRGCITRLVIRVTHSNRIYKDKDSCIMLTCISRKYHVVLIGYNYKIFIELGP